jgi:hypothetical protein
MGFSNFIALAIMITAAAALHAYNVTDIQTLPTPPRRCGQLQVRLPKQYSLLASSAPACCPFPS